MRALARYRVAARVVGLALVLLVVIAMPLQFGAGDARWVHILGPIHGFLYLVYLVTVLDLARKIHVTGLQLVAMIGAGLVPFLTFVVERRIGATLAPSASA